MPRAQTNKIYRTFVKGLITEASPLTYPENASVDEDNCVIFRKGNRTRRLGAEYEDDYQLSSFTIPQTDFDSNAIIDYKWEAVANNAGTTFLCQQVGNTLHFYDLSISPLSAAEKSFTVDLTNFTAPSATTISDSPISMASGSGVLFVVGELIEPFYVEYDQDTDSITTHQIYVQIRDFSGVDDSLANDEEPAVLTSEHLYNLLNQGWFDPVNSGSSGININYFDPFGNLSDQIAPTIENMTAYYTEYGRWPANNKQWFVGRSVPGDEDEDDILVGDFNPKQLNRFAFGNNRAPRGHFVVNAFYIDRTSVSGAENLPVESTTSRPNTVSFFAGRVWYANNSKIYFSQLLNDVRKAGFCYQEADPTSEDINDLIATDGGVIPIPEIGKVVRLFPLGAGLLIFANNGLWYVSGTQAGFSAVDFSIQKVSPVGTDSPLSIVEAEGKVFWWSKIGIQGLSQRSGMFGTIEGSFDKENIAEQTIQTFYNNEISDEAKFYAKGVYDPATNIIQWLFKDSDVAGYYRYNRILNLDLTLQAFYPWSLTYDITRPFLTGVFTTSSINNVRSDETVEVGGVTVQVGGIDVVAGSYTSQIRNSFIKYSVAVPVSSNYQQTFALFRNPEFVDWEEFDGGEAYLSFVSTGYEILEDLNRKKQAPYITLYFRRTEQNIVDDGAGGYEFDTPSSCMFQVAWDWSDSQVSGKWTSPIEGYRFVRNYLTTAPGPFDNGHPVVVTKNKVRGTGRAIQFKLYSDAIGKDFDLLGWGATYSGGTVV